MIRSLDITGFRAFERLTMRGLERVNLLVGKNNCGKTSVLEAIQFLASQGDPYTLWEAMFRRGEQITDPEAERGYGGQADISHLFHGHVLDIGRSFEIWQRNGGEPESVTASVGEPNPEELGQAELFDDPDGPTTGLHLALKWRCGDDRAGQTIPLRRTGSHVAEDYALAARSFRRQFRGAAERRPVRFVTTASLGKGQAAAMWNQIAATEYEEKVLAALQVVEPRIERIVALPGVPSTYRDGADRGGFVVRIAEVGPRVPIGSMGDGIWRMLGLSMSLATARGGLLLVDEIDTGLHYTVMRDMWRLVLETANRLNLQVFATTHSLDCWLSLADVINGEPDLKRQVAVHRIESERG